MSSDRFLTIGEFSRRVGVSVDLLRAWERRYGVPNPIRAAGGRRLYTREDERVIGAMRRAVAGGIPPATAAREATLPPAESEPAPTNGELPRLAARLRDALDRYDQADAQSELDVLFGAYSIDTALKEIVLPYMHELGERWAGNEIGVGSEHFAANLIHGRLLSLARKWDGGHGPRAVLACPQGELHTMGLLAFGLALRGEGWRITYLGADTPVSAIEQVAGVVRPAWIVLASVDADRYNRVSAPLAELASRASLAIAGSGASRTMAERCNASLFAADPVTAASALARRPVPSGS
jgi:MerR family transcriptional regulator, light-induced transcriptional regulator